MMILNINFRKGKNMTDKKERIRLVLSIIIALIVTAAVSAASDSPQTGDKEVLSGMEQRLMKKVSVNFSETPIDDVIKTLAEQANIDVIKSPDVTGTVTAKLTNVPLKEALDNILAVHNYGYVISENVIRIAPADQIAQKAEKLESKIYRITYADVTEVEKALNKFKSAQGSISSNPGTSNIIVTDTESKIKAIDTFIQEVDRITPQILVEARIYDITNTDRLDLGVEWQAGRNTIYGAGTTGTSDNTGLITGTGTNPVGGRDSPFITGMFDGTAAKSKDTTGVLRLGFLNANADVDALIRAQSETIKAKLLANPRILVLDNQQAEIKIVSQIPYQQLNQGGGSSVSFGTTEFKEVGVTLNVIPHLTRDGMIRLQLKPKFSVQTGTVNVGSSGVGNNYPQPVIDEREATTVLLIRDGQTAVLGGLRKKDVTKQINKVPLLGDLPLLGALFSFQGEEAVTSELVVFVTPRIVNTPAMSNAEQQQYKVTDFEGPKPVATNAEKSDKK
jgi:type IV pilus assembly protein PilQ